MITFLALLLVLVGAVPVDASLSDPIGSPPGSKCLAGKAGCVAKAATCLLTCHRKGIQRAAAVDPTCLAKCRDRFDGGLAPANGCFARREALGGCGASVGDAATFAAKIEAHTLDVVGELNPLGATPPTAACTAGKIKCVGKYEICMLKLVSKAAKKGSPINGIGRQGCRRKLTSCIRKSDEQGDQDENGDSAPGCQTTDDDHALRGKDDAFLEDVVAELVGGPNDIDSQRCSGDTSVTCTSAPGGTAGCDGPLGTCEFLFGPPLPISAGAMAACVRSQWEGAVSGTFNPATGEAAGQASLRWIVYAPAPIGEPCPRCAGDPIPNDGVRSGTCSDGAREGLPCDGNGLAPEPSFGVTSHDCPPSGSPAASMAIALDHSTGTITKTIGLSSPNCFGAPGKKCHCGVCTGDPSRSCFDTTSGCTPFGAGTCSSAGVGEPEKPHPCYDDSFSGPNGDYCAATANDEGQCPQAPGFHRCRLERFRSCQVPTQAIDCPLDDDSCEYVPRRDCFPGGTIGDVISATGASSTPRNHVGVQTQAALFCMPPTSAPAVNAAFGLPGPARVELGGIGRNDGTALACPSTAAFSATTRAGVLDVGWTGLGHDMMVPNGGTLSVQVTGCVPGTPEECGVCSYTGPIANAHAHP